MSLPPLASLDQPLAGQARLHRRTVHPGRCRGARRIRRQLVDDLKEQRLFSKVDLLSDDLRRNLADPKVIIPDRDFVLVAGFCRNGVPATTAAEETAAWQSLAAEPPDARRARRGQPPESGENPARLRREDSVSGIPTSRHHPARRAGAGCLLLVRIAAAGAPGGEPGRASAKGLAEALCLLGPDQCHRH